MTDEVKDTKVDKEVSVNGTSGNEVEQDDRYSYLTRVGRDIQRALSEFPFGAPEFFDSFFGADILRNNMQAHEDGDKVVFSYNVAGVDKKDISVEIDRGRMVVRASNDTHTYSYSRTLDDEDLDIDDVKAEYDKGILTITIPRHAREVKKIEIE